MKKRFWLRQLNNIMVGLAFTGSTILCMAKHYILGFICFVISYGLLDLHTYFKDKYNLK